MTEMTETKYYETVTLKMFYIVMWCLFFAGVLAKEMKTVTKDNIAVAILFIYFLMGLNTFPSQQCYSKW